MKNQLGRLSLFSLVLLSFSLESTALESATHLTDFVGRVYTPSPEDGRARSAAQPISGVVVTIMSGPHSDKSVMTDQNGQYTFPNVREDELHLLVEKEHFEPKAVIVHRSRKTILANGDVPNYREDPQQYPGNILIGQRWADEVRPILQQTLLVHDLLFVDGGTPPSEDSGGFYSSSGVVTVYIQHLLNNRSRLEYLTVLAHEIGHAHQHARVSVSGGGNAARDWGDTPEARAFGEARSKDWEQVGKSSLDAIPYFATSLYENAAETLAHYWGAYRWGGRAIYGNLEIEAPNRFKWAQEWSNVKPPMLEIISEPVNIPDPNLRAAVEKALGKASGAPITTVDMAKLTHLEARNANISDLTGLEGATRLTKLDLGDNAITDISVLAGLTNLTDLTLDFNNITDISVLAGLTNLIGLGLGYNVITDHSILSGLTNLTSLDLRGTNTSDLSVLSGLTKLERLYIDSNGISDLSSLVGLTKLKAIGLNFNALSVLSPLRGLTNLEWLRLVGNNITDLAPLVANTGFGSGDEIDVRQNPLNYQSLYTYIPNLESRGVNVQFDTDGTRPPDVNNDGVINVLDLIRIAQNFGTAKGDLNGDGTTDILDLMLVSQAFRIE